MTEPPPDSAGTPAGEWSDHRVEQLVGRLLQIGVFVAAGVVAVGGALLLARSGASPANFHIFTGQAPNLTNVAGIVSSAFGGDVRAVTQLGLLLLIATPVARVALTLVAFFFQRDRLYVATTALVLALLLYGLFWGRT